MACNIRLENQMLGYRYNFEMLYKPVKVYLIITIHSSFYIHFYIHYEISNNIFSIFIYFHCRNTLFTYKNDKCWSRSSC